MFLLLVFAVSAFVEAGEVDACMTVIPAVVEVREGESHVVSAGFEDKVPSGEKFLWEVAGSEGIIDISAHTGPEVTVTGLKPGKSELVVRYGSHSETVSVIVSDKDRNDEWKLVWEDDFLGTTFNKSHWGKIAKMGSGWDRYMSPYDGLYEVRDSMLILRGIVNNVVPTDPRPYLTGGLQTYRLVGFENGRVEVRAKLFDARGAWPAIWMMPMDTTIRWPMGGELDIMERLNCRPTAAQTVHSYYTENLKIRNAPISAAGHNISKTEFNIFGVELNPHDITYTTNGDKVLVYPRILTCHEGQFPFNREWYLMIDMQLGNWVEPVHPEDLPVEIWVDWVRFYKRV
jgi:beta-glucanase (GH16 family)